MLATAGVNETAHALSRSSFEMSASVSLNQHCRKMSETKGMLVCEHPTMSLSVWLAASLSATSLKASASNQRDAINSRNKVN